MARRTTVSATYQPCPGEAFVVEVTAADAYPDGLRQARVEAVRGVTELMAASLAAYPADARPEVAEAGDE